MRARVTLKGCHTFAGAFGSWRRDETRIISRESEVAYYRSQPCFDVNVLDSGPTVPAKPVEVPVKVPVEDTAPARDPATPTRRPRRNRGEE